MKDLISLANELNITTTRKSTLKSINNTLEFNEEF